MNPFFADFASTHGPADATLAGSRTASAMPISALFMTLPRFLKIQARVEVADVHGDVDGHGSRDIAELDGRTSLVLKFRR